MPNITRFDPVREVTSFDPIDDPFDDLFRGFFLRPLSVGSRALERQTAFKVDVTENDKEYRVHAEIPGVRKENINVTIDGDQVAISAETKKENDVKDGGGTVIRSERYYGTMYRKFTLGGEVDQSKAQAKYTDGVLELILPKAEVESAKGRRITVH